jgi:8-oxo-dGTP pyrophosphatase MutT (NUDIX family)
LGGTKHRYHKRYYYRGSQKNKSVICSNCSGKGHLFKDCKKPVQSFGVLGWTLRPKDGSSFLSWIVPSDRFSLISRMRELYRTGRYELLVCLIQRRHTISYEAFVRGKFTVDELDSHYLRMTVNERAEILEKPWNVLYDDIMNHKGSDGKASPYVARERNRAKNLYDLVIDDFPRDIDLPIEDIILEPTWEFPKGRKFADESEEDCAFREFEEETSIPQRDASSVSPNDPIWLQERFCGLNKRMYVNQYLVALIDPRSNGPFLDPENKGQCAEVKDAKWFTFENATSKLHSFHPEKLECLQKSHEIITNLLTNG